MNIHDVNIYKHIPLRMPYKKLLVLILFPTICKLHFVEMMNNTVSYIISL